MEEMYKMEGNEGRGTTPPHLCVLYHSITSPTTFHPLYVVHENNVLRLNFDISVDNQFLNILPRTLKR